MEKGVGVQGNKGGHKNTLLNQQQRAAVIDKCWEFLLEEMEDPTISRAVKREIALKLAAKSVPQDINVQSTGFDINIK